MTFLQLGMLVLGSLGLLVGVTLALGGWALVVYGRAKERYPGILIGRIGTWLIGICIAVLLILYWQVLAAA